MFISREPMTPTLFTLKRARQRHEVYHGRGETHRLDDPYSAAPKYMPPEPIMYKGKADHTAPFTTCYKQKRSLSTTFEPSIVVGKGGDAVTDDMFKPKINQPKKKKNDDEESDTSDTPAQKAYKKQQAHVEKLYWHEGDPGRSSARECVCVYGETRHFKRPKRARYYSGHRSKAAKEVWARLTRPKSAAVIRTRN